MVLLYIITIFKPKVVKHNKSVNLSLGPKNIRLMSNMRRRNLKCHMRIYKQSKFVYVQQQRISEIFSTNQEFFDPFEYPIMHISVVDSLKISDDQKCFRKIISLYQHVDSKDHKIDYINEIIKYINILYMVHTVQRILRNIYTQRKKPKTL